jgi:hypothetical protein
MAESAVRFRDFVYRCFKEAIRTTWDKADSGATAFGIIIPIIVHFVPKWEHAMNNIAWEIPVACLASVGGTRLLLSPFLIYRERDKEANEAESKLEVIEQTKPKIVLRQPGAEYVEHVTRAVNGRPLSTAPFIKVRLVNQPTGNYPGSIAHAVMARVKFYDLNGRLLLDMQGRWADSDQPSIRDFRESRNDLLRMDFGIDDEHSLDIAFRDADGSFVAWNNDNYNYPEMRKPEHVLTGDCFQVEIKLSAAWVDETFKFEFSAASPR